MYDFNALFQKFQSLRVGVIGDIMLDTYMWGSVDRVSPEAPVPIVALDHKEYRIGGAGNVALNLRSLQAETFVLSVTGNDEDAKKLIDLLIHHGLNPDYIVKSKHRITTSKTRVISRNHHMLRLDSEITKELNQEDEEALLHLFDQFLDNQKPDIVILQDYNKGVLTKSIIQHVIHRCTKAGVLTAVDPKRKNFLEYKNVTLFKPNLKEVKEALNILFTDFDLTYLQQIHSQLQTILHHQVSFITLSEKGVFYQQGNTSAIIPSHLRNISDVSGAGDTVIAVAALVYAATGDIKLMAEVANIAGGLVCEEVGTVAVDEKKLFAECRMLLN
jgi:rfaE bifunctional protein kinase chain/domain